MKWSMIGLALGLGLAGCGQPPAAPGPGSATNAPATAAPAQSDASAVIDGLTGKMAVDAGQRAKAKIRDINQKEQKDLDDVLK